VWNDAELAGLNPGDGCHVDWIRRKTDACVAGFESSAGTWRRGLRSESNSSERLSA
jgi:hypothetical protein